MKKTFRITILAIITAIAIAGIRSVGAHRGDFLGCQTDTDCKTGFKCIDKLTVDGRKRSLERHVCAEVERLNDRFKLILVRMYGKAITGRSASSDWDEIYNEYLQEIHESDAVQFENDPWY
eukprot:GHVS01097616.1.p1 GENE.GHVS01097616.1~~GHVS01097616.1.p1  ORF type:complete len:121 (+),score=4.38 GHVS01097616.1:69-431(+)